MIDVKEAAVYNASQCGRRWQQSELPAPWCHTTSMPASSEAFARAVEAFQSVVGLTVDGKLGGDTLAAMRSHFAAVAAPSPGDDDNEDSLVLPPETVHPTPVGRIGVSNSVRVSGQSIALPSSMIAAGISCSNFHDDGEHHFDAWRRAQKCQWFVFHESVSMSQKATIRTLEAKRKRSIEQGKNGGNGYPYGVHLICAPDGHLSCHADLLDESLTHASQLNRESVGCEWVNPYSPKFAKPPFTDVIPAPWWCWVPTGAPAVYTLPTPQQLVAAEHLCRFLPTILPDLPLRFPTQSLGPGRARIKDWQKRAKPAPGMVAHRDFSDHADGRYLLEHVMSHVRVP